MNTIFRMKPLLAALGLVLTLEVQALTLGKLTVLSSIGQPLVAEIEVPDISPQEASSLRVAIANADAFKSAGLDYNAALSGLTIAGKRRADGRALLELRSAQSISEPFLDLILEITWATGRMVRDYTLLLDPAPNGVAQAPLVTTPTLPIANEAAPVSTANTMSAPISADPESNAIAKAAVLPPSISERTPVRGATRNLNKVKKEAVVVKRGDTAVAIALANKPDGVSLDQMLVAMLRTNPNAFVGGNVNRLKAGVVLDVPVEAKIKSVARSEASDSIRVQAADFQQYRQKLAGNTAFVTPQVAKREAAGVVTAKVEEKNPQPVTPDRLTLNKAGAVDAAKAIELDKIAKDRAVADTLTRQSEIKKNLNELGQLAGSTNTVAQPSASVSASLPEAIASATAVAAVSTPAPQPAVAVSMPAAQPLPTMSPKQSTSFIDSLLGSRWTLPVGGALAGLLGLGALFAVRKRQQDKKNVSPKDSMIFPMTEQSTDTVFGDMGVAHQVDTTSHADMGKATAMVYPPSELGVPAGDVDAVAEADVYLAYNRDVQAEEILKEAKRVQPKRADVQAKLLEIYAKRHDVESFDAQAQELHLLTDGIGEHWARAVQLAADVPSASSLFQVSGSAFNVGAMPTAQAAYAATSLSFTPMPTPAPEPLVAASVASDYASSGLIDFDLSSLTLDLPQTHEPSQPQSVQDSKLALAEEYLSIGDKVGAKALIEEVMATGQPHLVSQAQTLLARIA